MTITQMLGRGHASPTAFQRRRTRVAAVITVLCLAAGCNDPEFGKPDEQTIRDVEECGIKEPAPGLAAPPGSYVDQGLTIDYARMGEPSYAEQVSNDPRMFEQLYADAVRGNVTARWSVCLTEATSRGAGRRAAELLASLRCQTIARCSFHPEKLKYSDTTASGIRVRTVIADEFEAKARREQLKQEIIGHGLTIFVGPGVAGARVKASTAATASRPLKVRPAVSSARSRPAAGAVKALAKPVYKPFTRANFRYNLAQRTGSIPENAQAHHVLPVKFEVQCNRAGINIHEPRFGTWWKRRDHQKKAWAYNNEWNEFFKRNKNPTSEEILQFGREIAGKYGLTIAF